MAMIPSLLLLLLFNRLPPDITGGQGLKNIFKVFFYNKQIIYTITTQFHLCRDISYFCWNRREIQTIKMRTRRNLMWVFTKQAREFVIKQGTESVVLWQCIRLLVARALSVVFLKIFVVDRCPELRLLDCWL
jgi:hypothetical protein